MWFPMIFFTVCSLSVGILEDIRSRDRRVYPCAGPGDVALAKGGEEVIAGQRDGLWRKSSARPVRAVRERVTR